MRERESERERTKRERGRKRGEREIIENERKNNNRFLQALGWFAPKIGINTSHNGGSA